MVTFVSKRMYNYNRREVKANWFALAFGLCATVMIAIAVADASPAFPTFPIELLLCIIVGMLSIAGLLMSIIRQASIHFVSFAFCFLFFSITPIVQIGAFADPIFSIDNWALWASVISLLFTAIGVLSTYRMSIPVRGTEPKSQQRAKPSWLNYSSVFLVTVGISIVTIAVFRGDLFTSRDTFFLMFAGLFPDSSIQMVAKMLLFYTPLFGAIVGLRVAIANKDRFWKFMFLFGLLLACIVNNPVINPRYQLAGLAFFAIDYLSYGKKVKLLAVVFVAGVMLAPAFQVFRNALGTQENTSSFVAGISTVNQPFLTMDYDAFQLSCYTMLTVDQGGIAWGSNLLGAALFFVPRSLWPAKPEPTSSIIYETIDHSRNAGTNNLSTPLTAEGYYAFGWAGVLAISFLYWRIISKLTLQGRKDYESWAFLWRCLLAGLALIFLRGTLIVAVGAIVGSFVAAAIPVFLIRYGRVGRSMQHPGRLSLVTRPRAHNRL